GQAKYSKTDALTEPTTPIENITKSTDSFDKADMYSIDFEDEEDWTFDFTPWTVIDVDGLNTYDFTVNFPNEGEPMAFIVLNPSTTVPPMDSLNYPGGQPHSGAQCGVCLASVPALGKGNDDWFISAMVLVGGGSNFNFWAKSYEDTYGLERFNVAVSTTTPDPGEFTIISGNTYVEPPIEWTEYNYDLSDYAGQNIYVAIQCVSYDAVGFMIDDLVIDPGTITSIWSIDFEDKEDWTFDFAPWTVIDVDGLTTMETPTVSFPHEGEPMAFIVGNPTTTVPPLDSLTWPAIWPHSGIQAGACINSIPVLGKGNDDWFISAMVYVGDGANFNFWAKTYYEGPLERFNVGVSTTTPDP
ncbi:MAG: choice-of-anchor J domain-containing protein, partial [Cyclobacteriaceae bacterium]|nr:choice-of-anchor J domain-containing protein [Cyclobacteriaceae bacterium]